MTNKPLNKFPLKINPYILAIAVLVLIIFMNLSGRRCFDETLESYMEATMAGDAEAVVDLLHDSYIESLIEKGEIESQYDLIQRVHNKLDWYSICAEKLRGENGEYFEYVAELQDVKDEKMDDILPFHLESICGDAIDDLKEAKGVYITYMCYYYNTAFEQNDERQITYDYYIYFVKIGQSWYLGEIPDHSQFNW